jgi:hypothetical protein
MEGDALDMARVATCLSGLAIRSERLEEVDVGEAARRRMAVEEREGNRASHWGC